MLLEISIVLASIVPTEKCEYLGIYVTTPISIYACGRCGAWLFVHKVLFTLRFFSARKKTTWYPTNKYYLMSHFNQPYVERKNCVWTTKYKRLSEMCIVQLVEMKSVFTIQAIKRLVSTTGKSAKPAATF